MGGILTNIKWHMRYRGYKLRVIMIYFLVTDIILATLPVSVCRYLDQNFRFLVMIVNLTYALSVFYFFITGITYVDGQDCPAGQEHILLAETNPWYRLFIRLFTNLIFSLLCFGNALLGSSLMNKFADANHSYFKLEMKGNLPLGFLSFALVFPLLYHLIRLIARRENERFFSLPALLLVFLLAQVYWNLLTVHLPGWLAVPVGAALMAAVFYQAGKLESKG